MFRQLALAALVTTFAASVAAAWDHGKVERSVELKDGSTVHIFADGKMGMEDRFGRAFSMPEGHVMETRDGQKIVMQGNEVWRVNALYEFYRTP